MKRASLLRATVAAALYATLGGAWADAYPSRTVTIIIPFPPGGTLDVVGRQLAQKLAEQTGQSFIIDNKPGGVGTIGAMAVKQAQADGYTLLFAPSTHATTPMTMKAPYDVIKDFSPIALVAKAPLGVSVNNDVPAKDIKGLITYAKANPGKLSFAIGSTGSAGHLSTELLKRSGNADLMIVPYKGSAPAYQDLIGGQINGFIDPILGSTSYVKSGRLRLLAVTSKARLPSMPDVPTVAETIPGYEFYSWYGLWGPAKLPAEVVAKLNAEVNKALSTDMREKLVSQGLEVNGGSVADFVKFEQEDMAKAQKIINEGKIRAD
ncbi:tripartite tricarboxylate transporter substrate binding protein [Variovorax rhizosphaerae]|uniref:Tripartite tricarboxylate transporter substrate binding protein n=1 Tax=Variovorax rhizosphaerae TaxID=1836200 RepID=A0ABU8WTN3_9BURK